MLAERERDAPDIMLKVEHGWDSTAVTHLDLELPAMAVAPAMVAPGRLADAVVVVVIRMKLAAELGLLVRGLREIPQALVVSITVEAVVVENKPVKARMEGQAPLGGGRDIPAAAVEDMVVGRADHTAAAMVVVDPHLVKPHLIGVAVVEVAAI